MIQAWQTPPVAVWWTLACLTGAGLLVWCLRVEPALAAGRRRGALALGRDALALLLIGVVVVLASPPPVKWELAQWMARKAAQAKQNEAQALARQAALYKLQALDKFLALLTKSSTADDENTVTPLLPRRDDPFPWRDMTEAEAESLNRMSVESYDRELDYRRLLSEQTSAARHHCQYRLWRANGGAESQPIAVITLLPDDRLALLNRTAAYQGWSLANDGTRLTLNLLGGEIPNGDHSVFTRVLGQFLVTNPPMRMRAQDLSGRAARPTGNDPGHDDTVGMTLKSVQRGPNALIRHATDFTSAPELVGRLRCTDAPPGQLDVLLHWLSASSTR